MRRYGSSYLLDSFDMPGQREPDPMEEKLWAALELGLDISAVVDALDDLEEFDKEPEELEDLSNPEAVRLYEQCNLGHTHQVGEVFIS